MTRLDLRLLTALVATIGLGCETPAATPPDAGPPALDGGTCGAEGAALDGHPCQCDTECASGVCRVEDASGEAHGFCLRNCSSAAVTCSDGARCDTSAGDVCYPTCTTTSDCPGPGRVCASDGTCIPRCAADSDCYSGFCDPYRSECTAGPSTGLGLWADCTSSPECRSGFCAPAGCVTTCVLARDYCPDGAICIGSGDSDSGLCANPCVRDEDCAAGESCFGVPFPDGAAVCLPDEFGM